MKYLLAFLLSFLAVAATAQNSVVKQANAIYMTNDFDVVKMKIVSTNAATQTVPWLEFGSQTNTVFSLPASGIIPLANSGLQTATNVTGASGLWTNTFTTVFSSAPRVFVTPMTYTVTNFIVSVTTSNVVGKTDPSVTNSMLAVPVQ